MIIFVSIARKAPFHFWIFAIISMTGVGVLAAAMTIIICTRSSRGMNIEIWNWMKYSKKAKKLNPEAFEYCPEKKEKFVIDIH